MIDFPNAPALGQTVSTTAGQYIWNGSVWQYQEENVKPYMYLWPMVGVATSPDFGVMPSQFIVIAKVRGPLAGNSGNEAFAAQGRTTDGFYIARRRWSSNEAVNGVASAVSTTSYCEGVGNVVVPNTDEWLAYAVNCAGYTTQTFTSTNGITWVDKGTGVVQAPITPYDSSDEIRVGSPFVARTGAANQIWMNRIYSCEMRTGLSPTAGTTLWKFDAADYPGGSTTSYVDPRGRTWTLSDARAIQTTPGPTETQFLLAGRFMQTPSLGITGDIDVSWFGCLGYFGPFSATLFNQFNTSAQRSWRLHLTGTVSANNQTVNLKFSISVDGAAEVTTTDVALPGGVNAFLPGQFAGFRATRRQSDGSTKLYYSAVDPPVWQLLGTQTLAAGSALFNSTGPTVVGGYNGGSSSKPDGFFRRAEIRNGFDGAGTVVAAPDVRALSPTATTFTDSAGKAWTWVLTGTDVRLVTRPAPLL